MSVNSQPKTQAVKQWLQVAIKELNDAGIPTPRLDAEIILAHTLRKPRTYLHAHGEVLVDARNLEIAEARLQLRLDRTPIAYIVGHKEFYGRQFRVTPATLIPRPESEVMIDSLKRYLHMPTGKKLVDVGTGSGCLGITAKLELPQLDVTLTDISRHALYIAETNARQLKASVTIIHGNLLDDFPFTADVILANLPYVDKKWERSPETQHEPAEALFASDSGLHLISQLIMQTKSQLAPKGLLLLEADPRQHTAIIKAAAPLNLRPLNIEGFILMFQKTI